MMVTSTITTLLLIGRLADQPITPVHSRRIFGFRRSAVPHLKGLGQGSTDLLLDAADY